MFHSSGFCGNIHTKFMGSFLPTAVIFGKLLLDFFPEHSFPQPQIHFHEFIAGLGCWRFRVSGKISNDRLGGFFRPFQGTTVDGIKGNATEGCRNLTRRLATLFGEDGFIEATLDAPFFVKRALTMTDNNYASSQGSILQQKWCRVPRRVKRRGRIDRILPLLGLQLN